jgi:hypothetical protein
VSGTITVTNPNEADVAITGISDSLSDGTSCDVTGGGAQTLAPGGHEFDYSCDLDALPDDSLTNTATVSWDAQDLSDGSHLNAGPASSSAVDVSFTGNDIDECIDVSDSVYGDLGTVCVGDDNPTEFDYTAQVDGDEGTCTDNENTASFLTNDTAATGSDSWTVEDCQGADLTASKDATPAFDRSFDWDITKSVDETYIELLPGAASATFNYTVSVSHDAGSDSNWTVTGQITVSNPNDWQDIEVDVTDAVDNGGTCTVEDGEDVLVLRSDSVVLDYTCTYASAPSPLAGTNTATVTWDGVAASTPNSSATGTALFDFATATPSLTDECIDVTDTIAGALGTVCVGDANPTEFHYQNVVPNPGLGHCVTVDNTASFTSNDTGATGSDDQSVEVCTFNAPATIGYWKTHMHVCAPREKQATAGCSSNGPFTGTYLPQSLGNYSVNTEAKALAVFNGNNCSNLTVGSNALACLAAQLLGAKLNIANGSNPSCISATITAADAFLISVSYNGPGTYTLTAAQRATAISLKTTLDNYNNNGC